MRINIKKLSDYLTNIGILLCLYSFYTIYSTRKNLPPGACPIDANNDLLYLSIFISVLGLALSFIPSKKSID